MLQVQKRVLEFITNFKPNQCRAYIKRNHYLITPRIIAEALESGQVQQFDKTTCKDWIKDYTSKVDIKTLEESLCWLGQARWLAK